MFARSEMVKKSSALCSATCQQQITTYLSAALFPVSRTSLKSDRLLALTSAARTGTALVHVCENIVQHKTYGRVAGSDVIDFLLSFRGDFLLDFDLLGEHLARRQNLNG